MFETYAVIGAILFSVGLISVVYYVRFMKLTHKKDKPTVYYLFESIIVVFIGVFYIYAAIVLSRKTDIVLPHLPVLNFTDGLEDLAAGVEITTEVEFYEEPTEQVNQEETTTDFSLKNDAFLQKYQDMFREIIKKKIQNSSAYNHPIFFNNKQYRWAQMQKKSRQLIWDASNSKNKCEQEFFIENALLLYSFVHCILTLVSSSKNCKRCIEQQNKEDTNNSGTESGLSTPVGPFFGEKIKEQLNPIVQKKDDKLKLSGEILVTTLLPILAVVLFYTLMKTGHAGDTADQVDNELNFNNTRHDPNILSLIQTPINITNTGYNNEVNQVIKNVYDIVQTVSKSNQDRAFITPKMFDIIKFLNSKGRESTMDANEACYKLPTKIYYFILFIVAYFLVVFYSKLTQVYVQTKSDDKAKVLNVCIISFTALWMPSVVELFFRVYLMENEPNLLTDLCLALGNSNKIFSLINNYIQAKRSIKNLSFVTPSV